LAWYATWVQQKTDAYKQSRAWWESDERRKLAIDGARGRKPAPTSAPAASEKAGNSSSGSSDEWKHGAYDVCASCPLCQLEQEQQMQQQAMNKQPGNNLGNGCGRGPGSAAGGAGGGSSDAVPYSDPFMWRRLLWQLLGKLNPESQAFYAQYLAMCPHCPSWL
jgi:hypothetical protein